MTKPKRVTNIEAVDRIAAREPFRNATESFRGVTETPGGFTYYTGYLPPEFKEGLEQASYAVYSYNTPIAWYADGRWYVPEVKYSITTSMHQSRTRWGIVKSGDEATFLGEPDERKKARRSASTGGSWGHS
jgi:hypothetical protein